MKNNINMRRKFGIKKILLLLILICTVVGCVKIAYAYNQEKTSTNKEDKVAEKDIQKKDNKNLIIGQKEEFKKVYGVDSEKVWNSLNAYDYNNGGKKVIFLTFDDGPSLTNTPKILNILKENDVKATFFVIGKSLKINGADKLLKEELENGMAIGNHSFTHDYKYLYPNRTLNMNNFSSDFKKNDQMIKSILGDNFKTRVIRCPGGQMSWKKTEPLTQYLIKNNMASMDWNGLNGDAEGPKKNAEQLYQEAVKSGHNKNLVVLLMHDTYGKEETVKALDKIIKHYKSQGYEFKTLV